MIKVPFSKSFYGAQLLCKFLYEFLQKYLKKGVGTTSVSNNTYYIINIKYMRFLKKYFYNS